jgi:hypothetical protein
MATELQIVKLARLDIASDVLNVDDLIQEEEAAE